MVYNVVMPGSIVPYIMAVKLNPVIVVSTFLFSICNCEKETRVRLRQSRIAGSFNFIVFN
jgi:hypothetical protein